MTVFQALVLGVLQGLSEFLPISSSAHLTLAPWLFGWPDPGLDVDVALHLGTLVALVWFFWQEWMMLAKAGFLILKKRRIETDLEKRLMFVAVATVPGAAAGYLLKSYAETTLRNPVIIGIALIVMGAVLWMVDRAATQSRALKDLTWTDAVLIGLAQMFALVPGVSRSGATITAGRALRLTREGAAVFSFLMSLPITLAAVIVETPKAIQQHGFSAPLIVGVIASAVSGWLAISVLLKFVARHSYGVFAAYRFVFGAIVLAIAAFRA
ncbi:MAG: undecaprenyl-diphosphate phosphatase [Gemmatimonadota bacterium]